MLFLFLGLNRENFLNLYNLSLKACPFLSLHSIFNNTLDVTESSSGNIKYSNSKLMFAGWAGKTSQVTNMLLKLKYITKMDKTDYLSIFGGML